ncbi:putative transmembrane protein [Mycolicibacterium rhodesiae JS60]|nr:putative transmembrane protein [Mycolicibacterium rhodesiae JS60]
MRNLARVLAFDVAAPVAAAAALLGIGVVLGWPLWWVSACSMLCLLIVEGIVINFVLYRRDSVTVGTDDDGPGLRLAVVGLATVAAVATVVVGYTEWTLPDQEFTRDSAEVVRIATAVSEATATFTPADPTSSIDKAASFMAPERADAFKGEFGKATSDLAKKNISASAQTMSAGLEALGPSAASVAVVMRGTQSQPGQQPNTAVLALRVGLAKQDDRWVVLDISPINAR